MFHLTFCGGSEVRIKEQDNIVVTVWGGTNILMPTFAQKMMRLKKSKEEDYQDAPVRRTNVITFQGGTVLKRPTVARELEDLLQLLHSGALPRAELQSLWQEALLREDLDQFEFWTLMGGSGEESPSVKEEAKDLKRIVARGIISFEEAEEMKAMITGEGASVSESRRLILQEKLLSIIVPSSIETMETRTFMRPTELISEK